MLCDLCRTFCCDVLTGNVDRERWHPGQYPNEQEFIYDNTEQAGESIGSAYCGLCSLFYKCYKNTKQTPFNNPHSQTLLKGQIPVTVTLPCPKAFGTRPWRLLLHGTSPYRWFEFCFFDPLKRLPETDITQLDVTIPKRVEPHIGTEVNEYGGSDAVCALAARWLLNCRVNHARCSRRNHEKPLPRRVVDVGEVNSEGGWSQPRIKSSHGQHGYYATLSYRWSAIGTQFCTTRENLSSVMNFIPFWWLPKTIQDAIALCRRLGYRYLWVDALCIIQNDDDDWNEACNLMASIFENSHLTISALNSRDSHAGLFHHRRHEVLSNRVCLRLRDGRQLTVRSVEHDHELQDEVLTARMTYRGWIMQEKLLSPAIIHFGKNGLYWECESFTISESFANAEVPGEGVLKNILAEVQRPGCSTYPGGHFIAWYMIIMYYSRTSLTLAADRLPAILGLARRFENMFSTTFVAGLWLEDLHRGLLWNCSSTGSPYQAPQNDTAIAPSWSWVSVAGKKRVRFEVEHLTMKAFLQHPVERFTSSTDATIIDVKVSSRSHIHRGAVQGVIKLWGTVLQVEAFPTRYSPEGNTEFMIRKKSPTPTKTRSTSRKQRKSRLTRHSPSDFFSTVEAPELPFSLDSHPPERLDYYCLIIGDWRFEQSEKGLFPLRESDLSRPELRGYLILQRIRPLRKHRHPRDLGLFKRIGMGAAEVDMVKTFFGSSKRERKFLSII